MVFLFKFYEKDKGEEFVNLTPTNNLHKTNKSFFNLKIFLDSINFDVSSVTDFNIRLKKENGTDYSIEGFIDKTEQALKFNGCEFKDVSSKDGIYEVFLEFYSGGILVYDGSYENLFIDLATEAAEFEVVFDDSKNIAGLIEMQQETGLITELNFIFKTDGRLYNDYFAYYFSPDEDDIREFEYKVFIKDYKIKQIVTDDFFVSGQTFMFSSMKDSFGNVKNKKYQIITKGNTTHKFHIVECTEFITTADSPISVYFEEVNVRNVKPWLKYNNGADTFVLEGKSEIGLLNNKDNVIEITLQKDFGLTTDNVKNVKLFELYFEVNSTKDKSNTVKFVNDVDGPIITCYDFDASGYLLVKDDRFKHKLTGTVNDSNMFYVSKDQTMANNTTAQSIMYLETSTPINKVLVYDELNSAHEFYPVFINFNETKNIYKIETKLPLNYTKVEGKFGTTTVPVKYISDFCGVGEKCFFIFYNFDKLDTYTQNVIAFSKCLNFSGPIKTVLTREEYITFGDFIFLKGYVRDTEKGEFDFDVLVDGSEQISLLKETFSINSSAVLKDNKDIVLDFDKTTLVGINSSIENKLVKVYNQYSYIIYEMCKNINIQLVPVSTIAGDFFKCENIETYINSDMKNSAGFATYFVPKFTRNKVSLEIEQYSVKKLSNELFSFEFMFEVLNGVNELGLTFSDINNNETTAPLILEKNLDEITCELKRAQDNSSITLVDEYTYINCINESTVLKLNIFGETYKQRASERYITAKYDDGFVNNFRILNNTIDNAYAMLELSNLNTEYEEITILYGDLELYKFKIKQTNAILLDSEPTFETGMNVYFLKYIKDAISDVKIEWDNKEFFNCKIIDNNYIEVSKIKDSQVEELTIYITAFDPNLVYQTSVFVSKGLFYNSNIIKNAYVVYNGSRHNPNIPITSSTYDLELECFDNAAIENIYIKDNNEFFYESKEKIATFDSVKDCFVIKGIVTPMTYSDVLLYIKPKYLDFELSLNIFDKTKIIYDNDRTKYSMSFSGLNENYKLQIGSDVITTTNINGDVIGSNYIAELSLYLDGELFLEDKPNFKFVNMYSKYLKDVNIPNVISGFKEVICKIKDGAGRVRYTNIVFYNINVFDTLLRASNLTSKNISNIGTELEIKVELSGYKPKDFVLNFVTQDIFGKILKYPLNIGKNNGNFFVEQGFYKCNIIMSSGNFSFYSEDYLFDINGTDVKHVSLLDDNYSKIKRVFELVMIKNTYYNSSDLNGKVIHYLNGAINKVYYPEYNKNDNMIFKIKKYAGENSYKYVDDFDEFFIPSVTYAYSPSVKPEMLLFENYNYIAEENHGDLFLIEKNDDIPKNYSPVDFKDSNDLFILERPVNVRVTYAGVSYIKITSSLTTIYKKCLDKIHTNIESIYFPCKVEHYNAADELINRLTYEIKVMDSVKKSKPKVFIPGSIKRVEIISPVNSISLKTNLTESFVSSLKLTSLKKVPHYLSEYAINEYRNNNYSFDLKTIDDIIANIENEFNLNKNNRSHVSFFKTEISKQMEEKNGQN